MSLFSTSPIQAIWNWCEKWRTLSKRRSSTRVRLESLEDRFVPSVSASFQLTSDWGAGFVGSIRINNDQPTAIDNWQLEFEFPKQLTDIWNAKITGHVGDHYTIDNAGYNSTIAPNSVTEFGFVGTPGNVTTFPSNYILNGVPLDGRPWPTLSVGDATVTEGDTASATASFPVTLSASSTIPVTVRYSTSNGTATAGNDYSTTSGTLTFLPGETQKDLPITILGDTLDEDDERFDVVLSDPVGILLGAARGVGTIVDNDSPPALSVSDATAQEPSKPIVDPGYFHTSGNQIVDAAGHTVRIAGVNWFGMETPSFAPDGLWARNYRDMMDQMVQLGFNTIRLPFSDQLFDSGSTPAGINYSLNPDLQGLNGIGILDKIVNYAGQIGLRIILDHHRSEAGSGAEGSGLWFTSQYPESRWIEDWTMLATRYANNPTVIGADLHNEPHGPANWGADDANDWRLAAERAGNAILAVNPNWLILTEGVEHASSGYTWWGGNLSNAGAQPVRLNVAGRLIYSPHDYPASVYPQPWFSDPNYPNNLFNVWDVNWGYLFQQGTAPILLGEFGSKLESTSDQQWLATLTKYLSGDLNGDGQSDLASGQQGPSWMWWSWNPNSGDTGGILQDDWVHVQQAKVNQLAPIEFPWSGSGPQTAVFNVSLSAPSGKTIQVNYATADGSATQGQDYESASGVLTFAPGDTSKTIAVKILADDIAEPQENFYVRLSSPTNAAIDDGEGEGTIHDASDPPPPSISIGDAHITEGDSGTTPLVFTVSLSAPTTRAVTVHYATEDGSALSGGDYQPTSGMLTFAAGETSKTIMVPIVGDQVAESMETFRVVLSSPTDANLAVDRATATIVDNDGGLPGVHATYTDRDDWGTGFVADISIVNDSPDPINGWTLEFDFDLNITSIWNAEIISHVGAHYVIRARSWNPMIPANGGRVDFGFQGDPGNASEGPRNFALNGYPLT